MQIQPLKNNFSNNQPQFKATYPVVYWVREVNNKYAPATTYKHNKKLQGLLVRMINGSNKIGKSELAEKVKKIVKQADTACRDFNNVRSYYDHERTNKHHYKPVSYLVTGKDVPTFDEKYGKPIGRAKRDFVQNSAELLEALSDYALIGLNFVLSPNRRLRGKTNPKDLMELHVIFEVQRNSKGKKVGYKLMEKNGEPKCQFFAQNSPDNPLVKMGYRKL